MVVLQYPPGYKYYAILTSFDMQHWSLLYSNLLPPGTNVWGLAFSKKQQYFKVVGYNDLYN